MLNGHARKGLRQLGPIFVRFLACTTGRLGRFFQRGLHALQQGVPSVNALLAGNEVLASRIQEANHGVVPGRLLERLERLFVLAFSVVVDADRDKVSRQEQNLFVRERTAPEVLTGPSPRYFLEEDQDRLAALLRLGLRRTVVPQPLDFAQFFRRVRPLRRACLESRQQGHAEQDEIPWPLQGITSEPLERIPRAGHSSPPK